MVIAELLQLVLDKNASDLHLIVGSPPFLRVNGKLLKTDAGPLTAAETQELIFSLLTPEQKQLFEQQKEFDFSYKFNKVSRFRVNAYTQLGTVAAALRFIPSTIQSIDELRLPQVFHDVTRLRQGLVLITGPTGEGKSTSLAAIIEEINQTRAEHIVTIEDPIEFVYSPVQSIISQREVHYDTMHWNIALNSVLREDPDVVLIGELRDLETIATALTIAETGHLVLATLHTNSAAQTVDRVIDVFPEHQQEQIRQQFAATIAAIFSQRLIPTHKDTRVAAVEVLMANPAIKNLIRESKSFQIDNVVQMSAEQGMISLEASLVNWVRTGLVDEEIARQYASRPSEFDRLIKGMV
ncbi:MAG: type IV pilus twitching motility protein PilT [Patescibacteria group bacterium]